MKKGFILALILIFQVSNLSPVFSQDLEGMSVFDLNQKGVDHYNVQEYDTAKAYFERAQQIDPDDGVVQGNLIAVYFAMAIDALNREDYYVAIDFFDRVLNISPKDEGSRTNIAFAYFKIAENQLLEKKEEEAIEYIRKGLRYDPNNTTFKQHLAVLLYNQGMLKYSNHDYDKATELLKESLEYDSSSGYTYEVLGDIAYYSQQLDEARTYWNQAAEFENSERLRRKINRLRNETPIDDGLKSYPSEHFIMKYEKSKELYSGYKIREILRNAYRKVGNDFNFYPKRKTVVLIYDKEDLGKVVGGPHWVGAVFDGKIRLPQENSGVSNTQLKGYVFHEYTHSLVHKLSGGNCPVWLNEGLAEYERNKIDPVDLTPLMKLIKERGYVFNMENDLYIDLESASYNQAQIFYLASFTMVSYLVERHRVYKIKEILNRLKEGEKINVAIEKSLFMSTRRLNEKWQEYLDKISKDFVIGK